LLLTAHHADDTVETLLMNFFRGTGLHGLTGIPVINDYIRRPLLGFYKEELVSFAKANQLEWVEDISNESSKYTRNLFRNEVIPVISSAFPQVKENLLDNIGRFSEIDKLYRHLVDGLVSKLCKYRGNEVHIPVKQLIGFNNRAIIYEIINRFGFSEKQVEEVIKLANSDSGKYITGHNQSYRIIRHRHWFIISPVSSGASGNIVIEKDDKKIEFEQGHILLEYVNAARVSIPPANTTALLDVKMIVYPLLLRKWKTGDYFYPLGMKKKKKLSRFFIDQKLSKTQKENAWVVESGKKIIWVVGYRIDERFKITSDTKEVARITFNNHHQIG
jgi:tRNA(Ile)-lysidine synthase